METPTNQLQHFENPHFKEMSADALSEIYKRYTLARGENVASNYALLETLPSEAGQEPELPEITVCMPIAINHEDPEAVSRALDVLSAASRKFNKPVDLILWTNARYEDEADKAEIADSATQRYADLQRQLEAREDNHLRIRTALQVLPKSLATMSRIRANYMDAVATDAVQRGLGYDHPVMWLDADTTALSKNALDQVSDKIRNFDALFVHPATKYSLDWAEGEPLKNQDAATKAVAIAEIQRRQASRKAMRHPYFIHDYFEESGFAFALGTYLEVGGVDISQPVSETGFLITKAQYQELDLYVQYRDKYGQENPVPSNLSIVPSFLTQHRTDFVEETLYIPEASITMSARRLREEVGRQGVVGFERPETEEEYRLFTDLQIQQDTDAPETNLDAAHMLEYVERPEAVKATTDDHMRIAKALVRRYFPNIDTDSNNEHAGR